MSSRRTILLSVLLGALIVIWVGWRSLAPLGKPQASDVPTIIKQPVEFTNRTFDPAAPPAGMPPLTPGEQAACDSDFLSGASVGGETRPSDATHATVTITNIKVTLQLRVTIWLPSGANQHVIEHEDGHRQISEYYYQRADMLARRIAAAYMGKQVDISGTDLGAESNRKLQEMAAEITDEYNKELDPEPTQLLYDTITDHSRNEVIVKDAVAAAIKNVVIASTRPLTLPDHGTPADELALDRF
jgi:hypothetical protein